MSLNIEQKQLQKQTTATLQLISLLQMTAAELQTYLERAVQENPVIDIISTSPDSYDEPFHASRRNALNDSAYDDEPELADPKSANMLSLYNDLCLQADSLKLCPELSSAVKFLARSLDKRGYLPQSDYAAISSVLGEPLAEKALSVLQSLSPAGIGARCLQECLHIQLKQLQEDTSLAETIVMEHIELVAKGHFKQISKLCKAPLSSVHQACALIRTLNPKPCCSYEAGSEVVYILPDILLDDNGALSLSSKNSPTLSINPYYRKMLETCSEPDVAAYLKDKFRAAELLTSNIQRRNRTILQCTAAIINKQKDFFASNGQKPLCPFTQAQLAKQLDLSESTVSRIVCGKYIMCSFGTFALSHFFPSALGHEEHSVSSTDVKQRIQSLISSEDKTSPLSDQDIVNILSSEGIAISRRTVSKYRIQMNIPGTFARKSVNCN